MSGTNQAGDKQTTVEEGTEFKGTMTSSCPVVVRGALDGDISAPALTVTETGTVVGNVQARSIRSEGVLAGRVDADDIYLSGSVRSDTVIRATTLEVKLKQERGKLEVTFGDCILEVGDDPSAEATVEPQQGAQKAPQQEAPQPAGASANEASGSIEEALSASENAKHGKKRKQDRDDKPNKSDDRPAEEMSNGKSVPPPA